MYQNVGISGDHSGDSLFHGSRVGRGGGGSLGCPLAGVYIHQVPEKIN